MQSHMRKVAIIDAEGNIVGASNPLPITGTFEPPPAPEGGATEAKQDDAIAILETLGTQTTLAAILAKIIAAPATEATLAAILAKIIAAPATAANQTTIIGHLDGVEALLAAATPAGTNEIGKVNWRHFNVLGATLIRPANTDPYSSLDSISNSATVGSVTALSSNDLSDVNDHPIQITEILMDTSDTAVGVAGAYLRLHGFNSDPTASSGVVGGDNAAWSNKKAGWFGSFTGLMLPFSDGSRGVLIPDEWNPRLVFPVSGAKHVFWQIQTLTPFIPSGNSTTFIPRFKGLQGRP